MTNDDKVKYFPRGACICQNFEAVTCQNYPSCHLSEWFLGLLSLVRMVFRLLSLVKMVFRTAVTCQNDF